MLVRQTLVFILTQVTWPVCEWKLYFNFFRLLLFSEPPRIVKEQQTVFHSHILCSPLIVEVGMTFRAINRYFTVGL